MPKQIIFEHDDDTKMVMDTETGEYEYIVGVTTFSVKDFIEHCDKHKDDDFKFEYTNYENDDEEKVTMVFTRNHYVFKKYNMMTKMNEEIVTDVYGPYEAVKRILVKKLSEIPDDLKRMESRMGGFQDMISRKQKLCSCQKREMNEVEGFIKELKNPECNIFFMNICSVIDLYADEEEDTEEVDDDTDFVKIPTDVIYDRLIQRFLTEEDDDMDRIEVWKPVFI